MEQQQQAGPLGPDVAVTHILWWRTRPGPVTSG
jgi:hypothetical protein